MSIIKRVLAPEGCSIRSISRETGVSEATIYNWKKQAKAGKLDIDSNDISPRFYSAKEKFHLLMSAAKLPDEELGAFLREHGLHSEHLTLWDQELRESMAENTSKKDQETAQLKKRVRSLEKELARKDKALAETTALLVLKKKLDALMGDDAGD
jgi:transposase-like protein